MKLDALKFIFHKAMAVGLTFSTKLVTKTSESPVGLTGQSPS